MDNEKAWVIFWVVVVVCITIVSCLAIQQRHKTTREYIIAGYTREPTMKEYVYNVEWKKD